MTTHFRSAEKVYLLPSILDEILSYLSGSDLCAIQRTSSIGWEQASRKLYESCSYHVLTRHIPDTASGKFYHDCIKIIPLATFYCSPCISSQAFHNDQLAIYPFSVRSIISRCPNIRVIHLMPSVWISVHQDVGPIIHYRAMVTLKLDGTVGQDSAMHLEFSSWEGFETKCELVLNDEYDVSNPAVQLESGPGDEVQQTRVDHTKQLEVLYDPGKLDSRVKELAIQFAVVDLGKIGAMCGARQLLGAQPITHLHLDRVAEFGSDTFKELLQQTSPHLKSLVVARSQFYLPREEGAATARIEADRMVPMLRAIGDYSKLEDIGLDFVVDTVETLIEMKQAILEAGMRSAGRSSIKRLNIAIAFRESTERGFKALADAFPVMELSLYLVSLIRTDCKVAISCQTSATLEWSLILHCQVAEVDKVVGYLLSSTSHEIALIQNAVKAQTISHVKNLKQLILWRLDATRPIAAHPSLADILQLYDEKCRAEGVLAHLMRGDNSTKTHTDNHQASYGPLSVEESEEARVAALNSRFEQVMENVRKHLER